MNILKKFLIFALLGFFMMSSNMAFSKECDNFIPKKPPIAEQKRIDKLLNERLNFTKEQKEKIRKNHSAFSKEMDKIIAQMQEEHNKIRNIYMLGLPPFQANIRSAKHKANLVILKQKADCLRDKNRKNFEEILTQEQKSEFEKIKIEIHERKF